MNPAWPWLTIAALGAFHGLNPAMGWLFAFGKGMQEGERRGVVAALPPIALGHGLSIALVALLAGTAGVLLDPRAIQLGAAGILVAFGVFLLIRRVRHGKWTSLRVGFRELTGWSFLMASAHGAGLMLVPALLALPALHAASNPHIELGARWASSLGEATAAVALHTLFMLTVAAAIALAMYRWYALSLLRKAWFNIDVLWAWALVGAGLLMLVV